jgi:hypothetical protein
MKGVPLTVPMHPFVIFLRDLWFHAKGLLCVIRRRHVELVPVGDLTKRGFRGVPMYQCPRCASFWIKESGAKTIGGRCA